MILLEITKVRPGPFMFTNIHSLKMKSPPLVQEQPIYLLPQNKKRAIIPKIVSLLVLGVIFYLGVLLNLLLLELTLNQKSLIQLISISILSIIIIFGIYLAIHQANIPIKFYQTKIVINKKELYYTSILNIQTKKDFFDKFFKTYSLYLGNNFYLRNIPEEVQLENYLRQLMEYSRNKR